MPDKDKDGVETTENVVAPPSNTPVVQTLPAGSNGPIIITVPQPPTPTAPVVTAPSTETVTMEQIAEMVKKVISDGQKDNPVPVDKTKENETVQVPASTEDKVPAVDTPVLTDKDVRKAAMERAKFIKKLSPLLSDDYDVDNSSDYDILKEAVKDMIDEGDDTPDAKYLEGLLKAKLSTVGKESSAEKERMTILSSVNFTSEDGNDKKKAARVEHAEWLGNRWKEGLNGS